MAIANLFTQIANSYRPRKVAEIKYEAGSGGSMAGYKAIYLPGEIVAAGTMSEGDIELIVDANDAASKFGAGSFGAWYGAQVFRGGKLLCRVYAVGCAEPSGGTAATAIFTFTNAATGNGTFTVNICGTVFSFNVENGFSVTNSGDAMVAAFNALDIDRKPPCTLVNAAGTVTATMANKGAIANSAPAYVITNGAEPSAQTLASAGACFGLGAATAGAGYPTLTTPLANLTNVVTPGLVNVWDETPNGSSAIPDLWRAHMETKCAAEVGHRGCVFGCQVDTSATIQTDIANLDDSDAERYRYGGMAIDISTNSPGTWGPSAACYLANAWGQVLDTAHPFDNVALPYMVAPPDSGDILTNDEVDALLEAGVCVLNYDGNRGRYVLVKGIGARLFSGMPQPWAIVDVIDELRYHYISNLTAAFPAGTKLAEDGEDNLDENCTTPAGVLDVYHETLYDRNMQGKLRNRDEMFAASSAEINASFADRVDVSADAAVMAGLSVVATLLRQRAGILTASE